jgi:glutathione S-transferase
MHAVAVTYARWFSTESMKSCGDLEKLEEALFVTVYRDLNWLGSEPAKNDGRFLGGDEVSAADTMVGFSVYFGFARGLCAKKGPEDWKRVVAWLDRCEACKTCIKAVEKTGHKL